MEWKKYTIHVKREQVDYVAAIMYDYPVMGIEIEDNTLSIDEKKALFADIVDIEEENDILPVNFYISLEEDYENIVKDIITSLTKTLHLESEENLELLRTVTKEEDWANNWKAYYSSFEVGQNILVKPTWESIKEKHKRFATEGIIIDIDPGMAFGSGTHETTYMCLEAIEKYLEKDDDVLDVGCGSGILGIGAVKLGARKATLIDLDANACKVARENVIKNKVDNKIEVVHNNLVDGVTKEVDFVVANILAEVILMVTKDIKTKVKKNGIFISSGIIDDKEAEVIENLKNNHFEIIEVKRKGGWVAIVAKNI